MKIYSDFLIFRIYELYDLPSMNFLQLPNIAWILQLNAYKNKIIWVANQYILRLKRIVLIEIRIFPCFCVE